MLFTVEGMYTDGKVELAETPTGVTRARVLVTFLTPETAAPRRYMVYGQFAGERLSTEDDFRIVEWHGEAAAPDDD
jgi:hypothetical protein